MGHRRRGTLVALLVGLVALSAAYGRADERLPAVGNTGGAGVAEGQGASAPQAAGDEVSVIGPWAGAELDEFWAMAQPFSQRQGMKLCFESTPNVAGILEGRLEAGTPPDIAILPSVGLIAPYARAGCLVPLRKVLDVGRMARQYPGGWLQAVSVDGEVYGVLYRATNKSIVWYSPAQFQGRQWTVPVTWAELVSLGDRIARKGLRPWALGLGGQPARGEAGTDWIENIILRAGGGETYDRWVRHEIRWTDPPVRQAFLRWGQIVGRPRNLYGGPSVALGTDRPTALEALYQEVPGAYLCLQGSTAAPLIARRFPQRSEGKDYDFFPLPALNLQDDTPVLAGAEAIVVFRDTPQVRALVGYLTSTEVQMAAARAGGYVVPNRELGLDGYADSLSRKAARQVVEATTLRFDASQQMPPPVAEAFREAVREFVANPGRLDAILASMEEVAGAAYPGAGTGTPCATPDPSAAATPVEAESAEGAAGTVSYAGKLRVAMVKAPAALSAGRRWELKLRDRVSLPAHAPAVGARGGAPEWPVATRMPTRCERGDGPCLGTPEGMPAK